MLFYLYVHFIKEQDLSSIKEPYKERIIYCHMYYIMYHTMFRLRITYCIFFKRPMTRKWVNNNKMFCSCESNPFNSGYRGSGIPPAVAVTLLSTGCRWCPSEQNPPNAQTLRFFLNLPKGCVLKLYIFRVSRALHWQRIKSDWKIRRTGKTHRSDP